MWLLELAQYGLYVCAFKCAGESLRVPKIKHVQTSINGVRTRATKSTDVWSCPDNAFVRLDRQGNLISSQILGVSKRGGYAVRIHHPKIYDFYHCLFKSFFLDFEIMFILTVKYREKTSKRIIRFSIDVLEVEQFKQYILSILRERRKFIYSLGSIN